jgi:hypothetical protein
MSELLSELEVFSLISAISSPDIFKSSADDK